MQPGIGCDAHKRFSIFVSVAQHRQASRPMGSIMTATSIANTCAPCPRAAITLEATRHRYWTDNAMEQSSYLPTWQTRSRPNGCYGRETRDELPHGGNPRGLETCNFGWEGDTDQRRGSEEKNRQGRNSIGPTWTKH